MHTLTSAVLILWASNRFSKAAELTPQQKDSFAVRKFLIDLFFL